MDTKEEVVPRTRVIADGALDAQKLLKLIQLGIEEEQLDYKREYNFSRSASPKDKLELVRDIVAMANTEGGYVVLGVNENKDGESERFSPDGMSREACASLDVSKMRQQLENYVSERIEIQFRCHKLREFGNKSFAIIFAPKSEHLPIIFRKDGQYPKDGDKGSVTLFRSGEIFVRKGASTERADQSDMRRIVSEIRKREKAKWTEDILGMKPLLERIDRLTHVLSETHAAGSDLVRRTAGGLSPRIDDTSLYLSDEVISDKIVDLIEDNSDASVRRYIKRAVNLFQEDVALATTGDINTAMEVRDNKLIPLLDSLRGIGVACIEYRQWELFYDVQSAFYRICDLASGVNFPKRQPGDANLNKVWIWQEVIFRVYSLGAILVSGSHWEQVRHLVRQEIEWEDYWKTLYWSRYVLTMASRANQLEKKGLLVPALVNTESQDRITELFLSDRDRLINAMCQFDFLQCLYTDATECGDMRRKSYPSFGIYYKYRTEPIIAKLVTPGSLRQTVAQVSDTNLAKWIVLLDKFAESEFMLYDGWNWGGWSDPVIKDFLGRNPSE